MNGQETTNLITTSKEKSGIEFDGKIIYFAGNALIYEGKHYLTLRIDSSGVEKIKLDEFLKFLESNRDGVVIKLEPMKRKNKHE